ncbi:MAG: hypothetical protein JSS66_03750 [Armatimonadetes bacterium]|nr:hypothetical protein [Armatimonadota bacterium]
MGALRKWLRHWLYRLALDKRKRKLKLLAARTKDYNARSKSIIERYALVPEKSTIDYEVLANDMGRLARDYQQLESDWNIFRQSSPRTARWNLPLDAIKIKIDAYLRVEAAAKMQDRDRVRDAIREANKSLTKIQDAWSTEKAKEQNLDPN